MGETVCEGKYSGMGTTGPTVGRKTVGTGTRHSSAAAW